VKLVFVLCLDPERSREILECDTLIVIAIERLKTRFTGVNAPSCASRVPYLPHIEDSSVNKITVSHEAVTRAAAHSISFEGSPLCT
jgi:hypothetical protein